MRPPDACFADPRQATWYDHFDPDRSDLDVYEALVVELGAQRVLDLGCGTGSLAVRLAARGLDVTGVDPALASLEVARCKEHATAVTWVHGDASDVETHGFEKVDLVLMTGNIAQVFVSDEDWATTLAFASRVLTPRGWLVFETRRPAVRDWESWEVPPTAVRLPDGRTAVVTRTVAHVEMPLVTFTGSMTIGDEVMESTSTLRFREHTEIVEQLAAYGFTLHEVREAPDRPGKEWVFLARSPMIPDVGGSL